MWRWRRPGSTRCRCITRCWTHGQFEQVLVCNAGQVKNVPGRKTDLSDAEWLAHLLECGLLRGSFIPSAEIKAARDVIRYRAKLTASRTSGTVPAGQRAAGRRDQGRQRGVVDRPPSRCGRWWRRSLTVNAAPRCSPSWRGAGCGRRSRTCAGAGGALRQPSRADVPAAPGALDHLDDMIAKLDAQVETDDAALSPASAT